MGVSHLSCYPGNVVRAPFFPYKLLTVRHNFVEMTIDVGVAVGLWRTCPTLSSFHSADPLGGCIRYHLSVVHLLQVVANLLVMIEHYTRVVTFIVPGDCGELCNILAVTSHHVVTCSIG